MTADLALLAMAALPLMGSPGPATLSCAATGAAFGPRRGLRYAAGVCSGTTTVLVLVATGVTGAVLAIPGAAVVITAAGTLYMLHLAFRIATAPPLGRRDDGVAAPSYMSGYLLAIANPKAYAAIGAIFASRVVLPDDPVADAVLKVAVLAAVVVAVNLTWLVVGAALAAVLTDPKASRIANVGFAVLLVASLALAFL